MSVSALLAVLPVDVAAQVRAEIASGRFSSADEVLRAAVGRLVSDPGGSSATDAGVLDGIGDGYFAVDFDWCITAFNRSAESYFGWDRQTVIGRNLWDAIPTFRGTEFERRYRRAMSERMSDAFELPSAVRPGIQVNIRAFPLPGGLGIAFRDVTEHRLALDALRANEERLRFALDASEMGDWSWDVASDVVTYSPAAARIFGLDRTTSGWAELQANVLIAEDAEIANRKVEAAMAERSRYSAEYRIRWPDGSVRWIAAFGRGVYDDSGRPVGMQGLVQDITARKDGEKRLLESEARLEIATRTHRIGIFDWHIPSGRVVWSDEEQRLFGLAPGEFDGTMDSWRRQVLAADLPMLEEKLAQAMETRASSVDFLFRILRTDGEIRSIEGSGRLVYDRDGHPVKLIGVNMDVTEREQHIADLERADRHLRLLVNELNHRVKNTLAAVQSVAAQTLRSASSTEEAREALSARLVALARAHDVLTRENWEGAELADVVRGAIGPFEMRAGSRFAVSGPSVRLSPKLAVSLTMALHELCTNAMKYGALSNEDGEVTIGWTRETSDGKSQLVLTWQERGGPTVAEPTRRGFGSRMIEKGLAFETDGSVDLRFEPEGVVCRIAASVPADPATAPPV